MVKPERRTWVNEIWSAEATILWDRPACNALTCQIQDAPSPLGQGDARSSNVRRTGCREQQGPHIVKPERRTWVDENWSVATRMQRTVEQLNGDSMRFFIRASHSCLKLGITPNYPISKYAFNSNVARRRISISIFSAGGISANVFSEPAGIKSGSQPKPCSPRGHRAIDPSTEPENE